MSLPERPYLSIGEVLGLLLDEFPDVSISKIRFLESQGLIGPERTPSGYRKFYDADVERLRVILREQRENFLPLRVIRDRLESGEIDDTGGQSVPRAARSADDESSDERTSGEPGRSPSVSKGDAADRTASGGPSASGSSSAGPGSPTPGRRGPSAGHDDLFADDTDYADDSDDTDGVEPRDVRTSNHPAAMHRPAPAPQPPSAPPRVADFFAPGGDVPPTMLPVERSEYSAGDVCALARLTARQLGELESFGLVSPTGTGTTALYSPNDLAIATIAAKFMERGIEARHLRAWKQAAEREAALFEQLIAPMLRQRNPQSRQMAADTLAELSGLGEQLRDALLRIALGDHLEP